MVVGTVVECGMITFIVVLFLDTSPDDVGFFVPLKMNISMNKHVDFLIFISWMNPFSI